MGISLSFITAISYYNIGKKKENSLEKSFNYAYSIAIFCLSIELLFIVLGFLFLEGSYQGHSFIVNFQNLTIAFHWLIKIAYFFFWIAFIPYYFTYEKMMERNKHIVSWLFLTIAILMILLPYDIAIGYLHYFALGFISIYFNITLFKLMKLSQRKLRAATAFILMGTGLLIMTLIFTYPGLIERGISPSLSLASFYWLIGTALCLIPSIINPDYFLRGKAFWYFVCAFLPIQYLLLALYCFSNGVIDIGLISIFEVVFNTILSIKFIKFLRTEDNIQEKHQAGLIGVFTQPQKITEEEVSIYRDKAICLVCKGVVANFSYICSNCKALYCNKCVKALMDMENVCWACDSQLDENKPIKKKEVVKEIEEGITFSKN